MGTVPIHDLLLGKVMPQPYREAAVRALQKGEDTILLANTSYDRDEMRLSREAGAKRGLDILQIGDYVQEVIGKIAEILTELLVGIHMVRIRGGQFDGLKLVTKAGAFGSEDAVSFAFRKIKEM